MCMVADDVACSNQSCLISASLSPTPPEPSTSVDIAVIIGVVVAVVIVILLIILAVFIVVLIYMKRRDTSESQRVTGRGLRGGICTVVLACTMGVV